MSQSPKQSTKPIEFALPTGIFARIRPACFIDTLFAARDADKVSTLVAERTGENTEGLSFFAAGIISRIVLFDDQRYTIEQVLDLDARDAGAIMKHIGPFITGPVV